ncbi:MAG: M16 family metallopeptidase [Candidatus Velthaea sp.]
MTRRVAAALCALLALLAGTGAQSPEPLAAATPAAGVSSRTLGNGLRVYVIEDHAAAVVQTAIWYRFGSLAERPRKTGLAHGLEHMMFRGTRAISGGGLDDIAARLGAIVNANTAEDYTHYFVVLPADRLELAVHIEADRMRGLLLREQDWSLEKGAVLSEIDGDFSQPLFNLTQAVRRSAFAGSPYALTALGVRADVAKAKAADLRAYYDRYYAPNNATLVVTGDVKPADVFTYAQTYFGAIASRPVPAAGAARGPRAPAHATVAVTADYPYAVVDCAYRIPGDLHADAAATQVFATLLNSERSAFYRTLVLGKLALGYQAYPDTALREGIFHVVLFVTPGQRPEAVRRAFETTVRQTIRSGVDGELLAAAKTQNARQALYARDSISGLGDRYGYALGVEEHDPALDDERIAALDAPAMNAAVAKYFAAPAVVGTLTPRFAKPGRTGSAAPGGAVTDDFSKRAPTGRIVLAPWASAAVARPLDLSSTVDPREFHLPNGLRVLVQPVHANPTVFVSGTVEVSPAYDPPAKTGLGGLTAGLLGYGSSKYDFAAQRRIADALGAEMNFGFQFGVHGLARDLDRLLDVLADGERHPAFPAQYLDLVRGQEMAAVSQRRNSPDAKAERAFLSAIYAPGDPILREETLRSLRAVTRADVRAYAARYIRPDHTTIVVAGDVDPDDVRTKIARAFGTWTNIGRAPSPVLPPLPPTRHRVVVVPALRDAVSVRIGERAVGRRDPDFYAFNLLNDVLGGEGSFDTRLMREIREQRGLVYGVSSTLAVGRERGTLEVSFSANRANVPAAVNLVKANLARLVAQPVTTGELSRARTKLIAGTLVAEESTQTLVSRCEAIARNRLPNDYFRTLAPRYARYTPADLLAVARKYIRPADLVEVYEGPLRLR